VVPLDLPRAVTLFRHESYHVGLARLTCAKVLAEERGRGRRARKLGRVRKQNQDGRRTGSCSTRGFKCAPSLHLRRHLDHAALDAFTTVRSAREPHRSVFSDPCGTKEPSRALPCFRGGYLFGQAPHLSKLSAASCLERAGERRFRLDGRDVTSLGTCGDGVSRTLYRQPCFRPTVGSSLDRSLSTSRVLRFTFKMLATDRRRPYRAEG